ncbi:hypothetical protein BGW80DRAFT_1346083 [Lactifluus volemus]|nr:hypothetical protein BGW80DRAFT_1346083 [Lactifluus volemus]
MSTPVFDYYKALGLSKDASFEDVRRAYKQKVLETHPDKLPPDSTEWEKEAAREQFSRVHEASEILGDPDRRREYDIHYRELPEPSIKSASSPKSSSVSMSRSDSTATDPFHGLLASARSATKSNDDSPSSLSRTNSMTSVPSVPTPQRPCREPQQQQQLARENTVLSSHSVNGPSSPVSRVNSSTSAREAPPTVSRSSSSATVRDVPPSVSRQTLFYLVPWNTCFTLYFPNQLCGYRTLNCLCLFCSTQRVGKPKTILDAPISVTRSDSTSTSTPRPLSRSNSTVTAPPLASVSRSNSIPSVTAISLHESSSIARSNTRATALTSVSVSSKAKRNYGNRISMASVASAFCDLPDPPYSRPNDYEALVNAMVQELYRLNPEWVERKQRLEQIRAQREAGVKVDYRAWRASWAS